MCWEKQLHFPAHWDFLIFCCFSVPLLAGTRFCSCCTAQNFHLGEGTGVMEGHNRTTAGARSFPPAQIPLIFHSWDHWEARACNTARGMKQPWHGHFSLLSPNPGSRTCQEMQGTPLQTGWDRWTNVHGRFLHGAGEWQLRAEINPRACGKCSFPRKSYCCCWKGWKTLDEIPDF